MTDPIADLLTRLRNAHVAKHDAIVVPYSKEKQGVVKILYEEGFVGSFGVIEDAEGHKQLSIALRYTSTKEPLITSIKRSSRPGRRYYVGYRNLKPVRNGMGIAIISTPKGILSDRQAKEEKVGGEILCTVW